MNGQEWSPSHTGGRELSVEVTLRCGDRITYLVQQVYICASHTCSTCYTDKKISPSPAKQQACEPRTKNSMTGLLLSLDFRECDLSLGINHKTNTVLLQSKPFQRDTCSSQGRSLDSSQALSGKDLAGRQGENSCCGWTPSFVGFSILQASRQRKSQAGHPQLGTEAGWSLICVAASAKPLCCCKSSVVPG